MTKRNDTESRTPSTDSLSIQHLGRRCGVYRWCALIAAMHWSTWMPCTCCEGEICKHFPRRVAGNGERVCNHRLRQVGLLESACSRFAKNVSKVSIWWALNQNVLGVYPVLLCQERCFSHKGSLADALSWRVFNQTQGRKKSHNSSVGCIIWGVIW